MRRVKLLGDFEAPISQVSSSNDKLLSSSADQYILYKLLPDEFQIEERERLPEYIINAKAGPAFFATVCSNGTLYLRPTSQGDGSRRGGGVPPPIRVQDPEKDDDDDMAAIYINDEFLALSSGSFVIILDLKRMWNDLMIMGKRGAGSSHTEITLQADWGVMHKLHSGQIRDLTLSSDSRYVISADEDGLICVADRTQMDRLDPEIIKFPSMYDEDLHDSSADLMIMCININASVQQILLMNDQYVIVLTDTHEIAIYNFDFIKPSQTTGGELGFDVISPPSREALEIGQRALLTRLDEAGVETDFGIIDIATLVCDQHTNIVHAVVTHSAGGVGLVPVFGPRNMLADGECEIIEGLCEEYARSAACYSGGKLIIGTDSGRLFLEIPRRSRTEFEETAAGAEGEAQPDSLTEPSPMKKLRKAI